MEEKLSINDVIESHFGESRDHSNDNVELDLDPNMPKLYSHEDLYDGPVLFKFYSPFSFDLAILALLENFAVHGRGRKRIITKTSGDQQLIFFDNQGSPIPEDRLHYINETIDLILGGEELVDSHTSRFNPRGTRMAARCLREMDGTLHYENINQDEYTIRARITVPYKS